MINVEKLATIMAALVYNICYGLLASVAVWMLWNWLMPLLFGLPKISFLDALGLYILCQLLFVQHR